MSILFLLIRTLVMVPEMFHDPICQLIILHLFWFQIRTAIKSIRLRCFIRAWATSITHPLFPAWSLCTWSMISLFGNLKENLDIHIPKLRRRYQNRLFIFLLLMEDNPAEKFWNGMMVFTLFWLLECDENCLKANVRRLFTMVNEEFENHISIQYSWYRIMEHWSFFFEFMAATMNKSMVQSLKYFFVVWRYSYNR